MTTKTAVSYAGDKIRFGDRYLQLFFKEKQLPIVWWNLRAKDGTPHTISNQTVLEFLAQAPSSEKKGVGNMIRRIDFANGDVNDYLKHLAGAIINGPMAPRVAGSLKGPGVPDGTGPYGETSDCQLADEEESDDPLDRLVRLAH